MPNEGLQTNMKKTFVSVFHYLKVNKIYRKLIDSVL